MLGCFIIKTIDPRNVIKRWNATQEMPTPSPRAEMYKRRPVHVVRVIPHPQEMDKCEEQEMAKGRPVVKKKLIKWYN